MSLILHIDTSAENASICLSEKEDCLCLFSNNAKKDHASWLHVAIRQAFTETGRRPEQLQALGITAGPGSYTGLRIGMAAAKGLCFTLQIPIIAVSTLEAMAAAAINEDVDFLCPMIDARRMEVFTGLYDKQLTAVFNPAAVVLTKESFSECLRENKILLFGNGAPKFREIIDHPNAYFKDVPFNASHLVPLILKRFLAKDFSDLAYLEPDYLKEYHGNSGNS